MVPLIINSIYTLYSGYLFGIRYTVYGILPSKGLLGGLKQLGYLVPRWASFSTTKEVLTLQQMTLRESKEQEAPLSFQTNVGFLGETRTRWFDEDDDYVFSGD